MKEQINPLNVPRHIAIIMDGNGRWAKKKGAKRVFGHKNAVKAVRDAIEGCIEIDVNYLTLYAFSTENWLRPRAEVDALMELLTRTLRKEIATLNQNNVRVHTIGEDDKLPLSCHKELIQAKEITKKNNGLNLILALSYSGRWDIIQAAQRMAFDLKNNIISENDFSKSEIFEQYLSTNLFPDPELLIRTSGEMRISNFLLWQLAYSEIFITPTLWPDFRKEHLYEAIIDYQKRERRFGKTSEQLFAEKSNGNDNQ